MTKSKTIALPVILLLLVLSVFLLSQFDVFKLTTSFFGLKKNLADMDTNGIVDDNDINQFLTLYESRSLKVDFDNNGKVNEKDAATYIKFLQTAR